MVNIGDIMNDLSPNYDLTTPFSPVAVYYQDADLVEYVREDACCVFKRIDETLTLALEMDSRLPIGFRIKGFKNLFLKTLRPKEDGSGFIHLISVIENLTREAGNRLFPVDLQRGYKAAADIARSDDVRLDTVDLAA